MASIHNAVLLINVILVICCHQTTSFQIEISPHRYTEETTGAVRIGCVIESLDECVNKQVILLELHKDGKDLIASVNERAGFRLGSDFPKKYQGHGSVENHHNNRSYLNVSILAPDSEDSGVYTCSMLFFNEQEDLKEDHVSKNLTVEIFNVHRVLETMMATVSALQHEVKAKDNELHLAVKELAEMHRNHSQDLAQKDSELQQLKAQFHNQTMQMSHLARQDALEEVRDQVTLLETESRNQSLAITDVAEKATYRTAFSARLKTSKNFPSGSTVVFDDIIINDGDHYDETTGIFTAPRAGLYAFDLAIRLSCNQCGVQVYIKANDVKIASMFAYDYESNTQQSASCVSELEKGDQVKVEAFGGTAQLDSWELMTLFTGYLVRAF